MPSPRQPVLNQGTFLLSLFGLVLLPMVPEICLFFRNSEDLKYFAPIAYYEGIVSWLLLAPALLLGRRWSRLWLTGMGALMGGATIITGFQAISTGARWDPTAHAALLQTSPGEAWGFVRSFGTAGILAGLSLLTAAFVACIVVNVRSPAPSRRMLGGLLAAGLLVGAFGITNAIRYTGSLRHPVPVAGGEVLQIVTLGINKYHPVTLLAVTHYNYRVTHAYYLAAYLRIDAHRDQFQGAESVPGAISPRVVVVVIGESASRRHWGLYGYARDTTPEIGKLGHEAVLFTDVISSCVGTQGMMQAMFVMEADALPVFPLFSAAGWKTHWLSAQYNQGENDVEIAALVQSCDQRVFLNGAYDEGLLPLVAAAIAEPGRHIIFVNLFGSHVRYQDRYPAAYNVFKGESEKAQRLAAYDNSIRYTDHVLAGLIGLLRARSESSGLLYVSDHAEDVYDSDPDTYLFRSDAIATNAMYEVPFLVWLSPQYRKDNPVFSAGVMAAREQPYQTVGLYQGLLDLTRLRHPLFKPEASLFSPEFAVRVRRVGAMNRVYGK